MALTLMAQDDRYACPKCGDDTAMVAVLPATFVFSDEGWLLIQDGEGSCQVNSVADELAVVVTCQDCGESGGVSRFRVASEDD